ncbi:hypothetical protein IFM89_024676 [Coptis chinensis]|uniref:Uncharacterized protein n=1 Tax=Coptis chinensis TaxID=261450 RepID=A0A835IFF0_9MAGN|nr:hypothetical protein IFM89_024676 [Coptis chinensis]
MCSTLECNYVIRSVSIADHDDENIHFGQDFAQESNIYDGYKMYVLNQNYSQSHSSLFLYQQQIKVNFLIVFFFILCSEVQSNLGHKTTSDGFKILGHITTQEKQLQGLKYVNAVNKAEDKYKVVKRVSKGQKGRGVYGGANANHPKNSYSGACTILTLSSSFISISIVQISLTLILIFLF